MFQKSSNNSDSYSKNTPIFLNSRTRKASRISKTKITLYRKGFQKNFNLIEKQFNSLHQYNETNLGLDHKLHIETLPNKSNLYNEGKHIYDSAFHISTVGNL